MPEITYPPVDVPKPVAEDVWIVDSGPMKVGPMRIPVRMTVIRLPDGALLLHSATRFDFALRTALDGLGDIAHLVAPNRVHWSFVPKWQAHVPEAITWAAPGVKERPAVQKAGMRVDRVLADGTPPEWGGAIDVVLVRGAVVAEAALFHRPSRTLVLTDLVVNVEAEKLPPVEALGARLVGASGPRAKAPVYARLAFKAGGGPAKEAARRLVALSPERVIFAHGQWYETDGTARLADALHWLTG